MPSSAAILVHENSLWNWVKIVDCGDLLLTYLNNIAGLHSLEQSHIAISGRTANSPNVSQTSHIITLGGDHTSTLVALRSSKVRWGNASVIHFDSHLDTWDPKIIGGSLSGYAGYKSWDILALGALGGAHTR
jgi:agmatinase